MTHEWPLQGKICLITGGTSGIGLETAVDIAQQGATVIITGRDAERGEAACQEISERSNNLTVEFMRCDLASQADVHRFLLEFGQRHWQLNILILNAAIITRHREESVEGIEKQFAVNHLSQFLLVRRLLDRLIAGAPARIVAVVSDGHQYGRLEFEDYLQSETNYRPLKTYFQSNLANIMCAFAFAREFEDIGVTVNCVHPGRANTNLLNELPLWVQTASWATAVSAKKAAESVVYLATSPNVAEMSGEYFERNEVKRAADQAYDEAAQKKLYKLCLDLTNIRKDSIPE